MFERESSIEKIVREYVPGFVVGTSHLVERYHTYKLWNCHVHYKNSLYVTKPVLDRATNTIIAKNFTVAEPDFV